MRRVLGERLANTDISEPVPLLSKPENGKPRFLPNLSGLVNPYVKTSQTLDCSKRALPQSMDWVRLTILEGRSGHGR